MADAPIYVDELFYCESRDPIAWKVGARSGHMWCHLWSADVEKLHRFAARLGMKREWFQDKPKFPHYDLVPAKRRLALALGAVPKDLRSWLEETRYGIKREGKQLQQANLL